MSLTNWSIGYLSINSALQISYFDINNKTHFRILLERFNFINTFNKRFSLVTIRRSWNFTTFNDVYCIFLNKRKISRLSGKLSKPLIGRFFLARNVLRFLLQLRNWTSVCKECQMFCRRKLPKCQVQFWKKDRTVLNKNCLSRLGLTFL